MKKLFLRGGVILAISAIGSKIFALWRDRLFVEIFGAGEKTDLIFASFRIPDFFFFLLVGATVSTLLVPKIASLNLDKKNTTNVLHDKNTKQETTTETKFFSSFLWGVAVLFGTLCGLGVLGAQYLIPFFATGFSPTLQTEMLPLVQILFGSVFLLALSSVFAASLQYQQRFFAIALAPVLYTGISGSMLFLLRDQFGITTAGIATITGAFVHLSIVMFTFFKTGGTIGLFWKQPKTAWKGFKKDFFRRLLNNAAFQINQTLDVVIASFLLAGSVAAFSLGSNLGHFLLSIVGFSIANAAFPKLAQNKNNLSLQKKILWQSGKWILFFCVPATIFCAFFTKEILQLVFNLEATSQEKTATVFFWTVLSLPAACIIPILARFFLANDDTITPLWINSLSLLCATTLAAILSLWILPKEIAILGLALGNFTANTLSAGLFSGIVWWKLKKH